MTAMGAVGHLLEDLGAGSDEFAVPYDAMIPPLTAVLVKIGEGGIASNQKRLMRWFYGSAVAQTLQRRY